MSDACQMPTYYMALFGLPSFTELKIQHLSLVHIVGTLSTLLNLYRDVSNVNQVYGLALDDSLQSQ